MRKHPKVISGGKTINMEDLEQDSLVMIQHKYYLTFFFTFAFIIPTTVPALFWMESIKIGFFISVLRYVCVLHFTWLVNSAAHMFGMKPYDKNIGPAENRSNPILLKS